MNTQEIVQKLWNLCNVLRDDGVTYQDYVTELTYILFLKMAEETGQDEQIPERFRWKNLKDKEGIELKKFYDELLTNIASEGSGHVKDIYRDARSTIQEPANLKKIITAIDQLDWFSATQDGLGDLYEGLLQKNAGEKKSGAGQYFTPRPLVNVMTKLINPKPGETCNDPAFGTNGFMIAADHHIKQNTDDLFELPIELQDFQKNKAFSGMELVPGTYKLGLMNAMLHDNEGNFRQGDTLSSKGKEMKNFDVVLTNPPFGTKKGGEQATRDDLTFKTSNKQLNFMQHIYRSLKRGGRAAVVVPDNVLFDDGVGEEIRKDLLNKCDLHTILRLPTGIFYAQGVKTNVLFFERGLTDRDNTKEVWVYDLRNDMPSFGKRNPLTEAHFDEFVSEFKALYDGGSLEDRKETWSEENPNGRWKKFTIDEILSRDKTSLDISWMKAKDDTADLSLSDILTQMREKSDIIANAVSELEKLLEGVGDD